MYRVTWWLQSKLFTYTSPHIVAVCVCVKVPEICYPSKFPVFNTCRCVELLTLVSPWNSKVLERAQGGCALGCGDMAGWDCNLKRCWVSMGESKEKWGGDKALENSNNGKKRDPSPHHQRGKKKPRMTQCYRTQLPGENHDGHLGSPNSTNKLIFDSPMSCCAQATCLPFSISLIISRGGYIFAKLHLKELAPSPHRFSLSVPVGDLSAVLHSPPSKFLPALVICTYGEHMSQAKNKISEVM